MKKIMLLTCTLMLCMVYSAVAATYEYGPTHTAPIVIDEAGENTVVLAGVTVEMDWLDPYSAIEIKTPAEKVTIILMDGTENTLRSGSYYAGIANNGIDIVIRCESAGKGHKCNEHCGKLTVTGGYGSAGIGGNDNQPFSGDCTILGGNIQIQGGTAGAGIGGGGGKFYTGGEFTGTVTISGGNVTVNAGHYASGIGGGHFGAFMGKVNVTDGNIMVQGAPWGAGIGSSEEGDMTGTITISGGKVTVDSLALGAAIGATNGNMKGSIIISGGTVVAKANEDSAGIGAGSCGTLSGSVIISGGTVTVIGGKEKVVEGTVVPFANDAIGVGSEGIIDEDAIIIVSPEDEKIVVKVGADEASASELEGSAFVQRTSLKNDLKGKNYANFESAVSSVPEIPQTGDVPDVPQTGDRTNFALLAVFAVAGLMGMTVILRKKKEA